MNIAPEKPAATFSDLAGLTLARIDVSDDKETITLGTAGGRVYRMWHDQDCCETVRVEDVTGDLADLVAAPLLRAEERSDTSDTEWGSQTYTFYELSTIKGSVTIRWLGESNGYYSESVDFEEVKP